MNVDFFLYKELSTRCIPTYRMYGNKLMVIYGTCFVNRFNLRKELLDLNVISAVLSLAVDMCSKTNLLASFEVKLVPKRNSDDDCNNLVANRV